FTIILSHATHSQTVTVSYATADGTAHTSDNDYTSASGSLTFNAGETSKTVTVSVIGDLTYEQAETFYVNLSSASNATIGDSQGVGTIVNDDVGLGGPGQPQLFAGAAIAPGPDTVSVSEDELAPFIAEGAAEWAAAGFDVSSLSGVRYVVADLPDNML